MGVLTVLFTVHFFAAKPRGTTKAVGPELVWSNYKVGVSLIPAISFAVIF